MYVTLSKVHPITLAVGNTAKRVFIIVAGILVFSTPVTVQTAIGSTIGIGGVFVYSLMKQWYGESRQHITNEAKKVGEESKTELALHT
jgi:solute carrier family 35 protein E1